MISHDARDVVESGVECRHKASLKNLGASQSCFCILYFFLSTRSMLNSFSGILGDGGGV